VRVPSPALVISVIALFVALGGTSYAVTQLPRNSVGTEQLSKNAVTSQKIKDGTIATADLAAATRAALTGATGATGATGPAGPTGPAGATGPMGAPGTASGFAAKTSTDALSTSFQTVLSLSQSPTRSGTITVAQRSRLAITASVTGYGAGNGAIGTFTCRPKASSGGQDVPLEATTVNAWGNLPNGPVTFLSIPVVGSALVDAGTYDVSVECACSTGSLIVTVDAYLVVQAAAA
jgi:hypothetical protein